MPPQDDIDERNAIVEVRGGSAGEEAALFAEELFGTYLRYAEQRGWKSERLGIRKTDLDGFEARAVISGRGAFGRLKFESGVHVVQRPQLTDRRK